MMDSRMTHSLLLGALVLCVTASRTFRGTLQAHTGAVTVRKNCIVSMPAGAEPVSFEIYLTTAPSKFQAALTTGSLFGLTSAASAYDRTFLLFPECITDQLENLRTQAATAITEQTSVADEKIADWKANNGFDTKDDSDKIDALSAIKAPWSAGENAFSLIAPEMQRRRAEINDALEAALEAVPEAVENIIERYAAVATDATVSAGVQKVAEKQKKIVQAMLQKSANKDNVGKTSVAAAIVGLSQQATRIIAEGDNADWTVLADLMERAGPIEALLTARGVKMPKAVNVEQFKEDLAAVEAKVKVKTEAAQADLDAQLATATAIPDTEERLRAQIKVLEGIDTAAFGDAKAAYVANKLAAVKLELEEFLVERQEKIDKDSFNFLMGEDKAGTGYDLMTRGDKITKCGQLRRCSPASCDIPFKQECPAPECDGFKTSADGYTSSGPDDAVVTINEGVIWLANQVCFQYFTIEKLDQAMAEALRRAELATGATDAKISALNSAASGAGAFWSQVIKEDRTRFIVEKSQKLKAQCARMVSDVRTNGKELMDGQDAKIARIALLQLIKAVPKTSKKAALEKVVKQILSPSNGKAWPTGFDLVANFGPGLVAKCKALEPPLDPCQFEGLDVSTAGAAADADTAAEGAAAAMASLTNTADETPPPAAATTTNTNAAEADPTNDLPACSTFDSLNLFPLKTKAKTLARADNIETWAEQVAKGIMGSSATPNAVIAKIEAVSKGTTAPEMKKNLGAYFTTATDMQTKEDVQDFMKNVLQVCKD